MRIFVLSALLLCFSILSASAQPVMQKEVVANAVDGYIRPAFVALNDAAIQLQAETSQLCGEPSQAQLTATQDQFKAVVTAFSKVEFIRFGPLSEENRFERLLFWPDRKGIALRQVQTILAEYDEGATDEASLRGKSVAVQGLGALEFVLFGTGSETLAAVEADFRCRYADTIAAAIKTVTRELAEAWTDENGIGKRLMAPVQANDDFRTETESIEALMGAIAHGIEFIRDTRILPVLGRDGEKPKPKSGLLWRSGMTVPSIGANFQGLDEFFTVSRIGEATARENLWVDNGAKFEFANAIRASADITLPLEQALADPEQKKAFGYLLILTRSLQTLIGENLAAALGLSVGFSSLDGD